VNNNKVDTAYDLMNEVENSMGENIWVKYREETATTIQK